MNFWIDKNGHLMELSEVGRHVFLERQGSAKSRGQTERRGGDSYTSSVCGSPDSITSLSFLVPSSQQFPKYFLDLLLFPSMVFI